MDSRLKYTVAICVAVSQCITAYCVVALGEALAIWVDHYGRPPLHPELGSPYGLVEYGYYAFLLPFVSIAYYADYACYYRHDKEHSRFLVRTVVMLAATFCLLAGAVALFAVGFARCPEAGGL